MLILTRRPNETLCIGDDVRVTVLSAIGHQVRLRIQAPLSVAVDRAEIYADKHAEQSPPSSQSSARAIALTIGKDSRRGDVFER